jgi:hypothetical protein
MAIYKNREVTVTGLTPLATLPPTVNLRHKDGSNEHVSIGHVAFTKSEKESLKKAYPSIVDDLPEASDEDIAAVKQGVTPPSDPVLKEQAELKAKHKKQQEAVDKANKEAEDKATKELDKPKETDGTPTAHSTYVAPNTTKAD